MEITPQLLTEKEFHQSLRGYDQDDVDRFLEQVAAGVAALQGRLAEALRRAEAAERMTSGVVHDEAGVSTETITRTLVLAQQTADQTIADAEAHAAQLRATAEEAAATLEADTGQRRVSMQEALDAELADRRAEATGRIEREIAALSDRRDRLRDSLAELQPQLDTHRNRLAATTAALQELVDDEGPFVLDLAVDADLMVDADGAASAGMDAAVGASADDDRAWSESESVGEDGVFDYDDNNVAAASEAPVVDVSDETVSGRQAGSTVFAGVVDQPTEAVSIVDVSGAGGSAGDSGFLDELRDAVSGDDDSAAMDDFFEDGDDQPARRFGRER